MYWPCNGSMRVCGGNTIPNEKAHSHWIETCITPPTLLPLLFLYTSFIKKPNGVMVPSQWTRPHSTQLTLLCTMSGGIPLQPHKERKGPCPFAKQTTTPTPNSYCSHIGLHPPLTSSSLKGEVALYSDTL